MIFSRFSSANKQANPHFDANGVCPCAEPCDPKTCPLSFIPKGERVRLVKIEAGQQLKHRLTEMGLTPGAEFNVVQDVGGPVLLAIQDSRLAIGRGMAHKILVTPVEGVS